MVISGRFRKPSPPPSAPAVATPEKPPPPKLSKKEEIEQKWLLAEANYHSKWLPYFPWLLLVRAKDGHPSLNCCICRAFGKETTKYSSPGDGARDLQTQTMRIHEHSNVHKEAVERQLEIEESLDGKQKKIGDFTTRDVEGRRVVRLLPATEFICKVDAPISMFAHLLRFMSEQDTPYILRHAYGVYLTRWLSRGVAVRRFCKVLGASIVLLYESKHKLYDVVTSYKFQFCLFFLADVLGIMNELNVKFQKREVDVTEIAKDIDEATGDLRRHYLECEDLMGAGESPALSEFLKFHGRSASKKVKVRGVDSEGEEVTHKYKLYERKIKGHEYGSTYTECEKLCTKFAQECVNRLNFRLADLRRLAPTKLFRAAKWPKPRQQRDRKTREYLHGCAAIFDNKLPGFDLQAAEKELATWAPIMVAHHEDEGFFQGLKNFMGVAESSRRPAKTPVFAAAERKRKMKELADDHERERVVRGLEWDRDESDEDEEVEAYDKKQVLLDDDPFREVDEEEAYNEDQALDDDPFCEEDEEEDVEEIAMDQPES
ncbi:unnamed protein product [Closterium sp. Naga37s-1]|nr:unnamed protein product [Closterium sp. Naga37s-1]